LWLFCCPDIAWQFISVFLFFFDRGRHLGISFDTPNPPFNLNSLICFVIDSNNVG
jgi:hypothetical protein